MAHRSTSSDAWRWVFAAAALWTSFGAVPALVDPVSTFALFHAAPLDSPQGIALYRGAAGQTLLFAVGYLMAAAAPDRHAALLALGGVGKAAYAARLLSELAAGGAGPLAAVAALGDLLFVAAFAAFLVRRHG